MGKKRLLSGMQPTGLLHLGNLEGALANWVQLQDEYEAFYFVANWHSLTTMHDKTELIKQYTHEVAIDFLAAGLDPEKCSIFVQSDVLEHAELHLLLSMVTPVSWLERVPTYKEKQDNIAMESVSYGLLGYPVLMSADILMYKADAVPVGKDQLPHLELTREIGRRFNYLYGNVFPDCEGKLTEFAAMPGLDGRKMSKSYDNAIYICDSAKDTENKVRSMYTDPLKIHKDSPGHPDGCAVFAMMQLYDRDEVAQLHGDCEAGRVGCMACKKKLAKILNERLEPIRDKRKIYEENPALLEEILAAGADKARKVARETMSDIRNAMGMR